MVYMYIVNLISNTLTGFVDQKACPQIHGKPKFFKNSSISINEVFVDINLENKYFVGINK